MEVLNTNVHVFALVVAILGSFLVTVKGQNGQQINTPCTSSMVSTFTPCMNYVTGSTSGGSSPSSDCCDALKSVTSDSMDCACLLVTASIPLPLSFVNRTLALALPRMCQTHGVPLIACQGSGAPLPPPGPLQFGAPPPPPPLPFGTPPPSSAFSPQASKATASTPAIEPTPADLPMSPTVSSPSPSVEAERPSRTARVRPVRTPSASSASHVSIPTFVLILLGLLAFMS